MSWRRGVLVTALALLALAPSAHAAGLRAGVATADITPENGGTTFEKDSLVARVKDLGFTHETILYTGTHTHSGPGDLADWQIEQLARAIRKAHEELAPARAAWGRRRVLDVNRNR